MSIDPQSINSDELKSALDREVGDITDADVDRLVDAAAPPAPAQSDESGRIHGRIIGVRGADVFVDVGAKAEAVLPLEEFDADAPPEPGQTRTFVLHDVDATSGLLRLSLREVRAVTHISDVRVGDVIEARVTGVNLGGLELDARGVRAFMPKSQVAIERLDDFAQFVGHKMEAQVTEVDRKGKRVVLSRRRVLEKEREAAREAIKGELSEGQVRPGVVRRLADFGAFVDIGGVDGLLHVSDMSYGRVGHPKELVKVGQELQVKVLKIDAARDRISLGLKQLEPDPWNVVSANFREGEAVDGRVTKLMNFGAFVELQPGVEGLIPISEMSWTQRIRHPKDIVKEGDSVRCSVLKVEPENRKLTLSLRALGEDPWANVADRYGPDTVVSGRVARLADFGAFIELEEGVEGLAHISELSDKHVRSVGDAVEVGQVVQCRILGVDMEQRRIKLSLKQAVEKATPAHHDHGGRHAEAPAARPEKKRKKPLRGGLAY
ncbi:MAG: S1 RNA-binding domain-containing protein [Phycisphaerales bacterium]|nr:S1 RNA-binding domain-containing protein [Phycisphaerales bacterium]